MEKEQIATYDASSADLTSNQADQPFSKEIDSSLKQQLREEIYFLRERVQSSANDLDKNFGHLITEAKATGLWIKGDYLRLDMYLREAELLEDLLGCCEREPVNLENILGRRLHQVDRCLVNRVYWIDGKGYYDKKFWQMQGERQILIKILNDWWHWLSQPIKPK